MGQGGDGLLGNDKKVLRALRIHIIEGQALIIFVNRLARDLAPQNTVHRE